MSKPHSHVPYGKEGTGYHSDSSSGCKDVIEHTIPDVLSALESVPFSKKDGAFTICDYGTADGGTSLRLMSSCIRRIKELYGDDQEVHVVYEDQPVNDFKSLFMRIHGLLPGPSNYYSTYKNVFVSAVGTSFYSQVVPTHSVHLGFSATAFHYLSKSPCQLDGMHHTCSKDEDLKTIFAAQAASDWETILLMRAAEMKAGAMMYIACMCVDEEGNHHGRSVHTKESMYMQMTECWAELADEGRITQEERKALQINSYYRNEAELKAPFEAGNPVYEAGLRMVSYHTKEVLCPYHLKWIKEGKKGDAEAARKHAKWFMPNTRVWSNYSFVSALDDGRTSEEKAQIVDECFQKYEDRVAAAPADHSVDFYHAYILLEKV